MSVVTRYRAAIAKGELKDDAAQARAAGRLAALSVALASYKPGRRLFFGRANRRAGFICGAMSGAASRC